MGRLDQNASELMSAAETALRSGNAVSDMTILVGREGGIRMIANSDWPLDSLSAHYGAGQAYRVTARDARIRVEGRGDGRTCVLETMPPARAARMLLGGAVRTCAAAVAV